MHHINLSIITVAAISCIDDCRKHSAHNYHAHNAVYCSGAFTHPREHMSLNNIKHSDAGLYIVHIYSIVNTGSLGLSAAQWITVFWILSVLIRKFRFSNRQEDCNIFKL